MVIKKKRRPSAQQRNSSVEDLVKQISYSINGLADLECDPTPPGCSGPLGSGSYEGLAKEVQEANAARKKIISKISKDFETLTSMI